MAIHVVQVETITAKAAESPPCTYKTAAAVITAHLMATLAGKDTGLNTALPARERVHALP